MQSLHSFSNAPNTMAESRGDTRTIGWGKTYANMCFFTPDDTEVLITVTSAQNKQSEILNRLSLLRAVELHSQALSGGTTQRGVSCRIASDEKILVSQITTVDSKGKNETHCVQLSSVPKGLTYLTYCKKKQTVTIPLCLTEHAYQTVKAISRLGSEALKIRLLYPIEVKSWRVSKSVHDKWKQWRKEILGASRDRCDDSECDSEGDTEGNSEDERADAESVKEQDSNDTRAKQVVSPQGLQEERETNSFIDLCTSGKTKRSSGEPDKRSTRKTFEELCALRKTKLMSGEPDARATKSWKPKIPSNKSAMPQSNKVSHPYTKAKFAACKTASGEEPLDCDGSSGTTERALLPRQPGRNTEPQKRNRKPLAGGCKVDPDMKELDMYKAFLDYF